MNNKEKIDKRVEDLLNLEMSFDGDFFYGKYDYNSDFNVYASELICDDEQEWNNKIEKLQKELIRRKEEVKL